MRAGGRRVSLNGPAPTGGRAGTLTLLQYLDTWLLNVQGDGTVDGLYRCWMLGEVKQTLPPRWSIIRNLLGWTG
jgi:hypothetical protein